MTPPAIGCIGRPRAGARRPILMARRSGCPYAAYCIDTEVSTDKGSYVTPFHAHGYTVPCAQDAYIRIGYVSRCAA